MTVRRDLHLRGFAFVVLVLLGWEALARGGLVSTRLFPPMSRIFEAIWAQLQQGQLDRDMLRTLIRAGLGFGLAILTMVPAGVLIGASSWLQRLFTPIIEVLRPLPTPVIIPVAALFLGVGDATKAFVIFYGCAFPVLLNTVDGVRGVHPMTVQAARSLRLTRRETLVEVVLPAALPRIMSGIRTSLALALLLGVVVEMIISSDGIGRFIVQSQDTFKVPDMFGGVIALAVCAYALNRLYLLAEGRLLRWHHLSSGERRG